MTVTLLAISAAYVVLALVVLSMGLTSKFAWWVKASTIVVSSAFFVEVFFASKSLLGWPASSSPLPSKFQLLWTRVVEPDLKAGNRGAIYLWVEEVDGNNVPSGLPRSYRLPYSVKLADRTLKARDEIMAGNPQEGLAEDVAEGDPTSAEANAQAQPAGRRWRHLDRRQGRARWPDRPAFRASSSARCPMPLLPPKP